MVEFPRDDLEVRKEPGPARRAAFRQGEYHRVMSGLRLRGPPPPAGGLVTGFDVLNPYGG